MALIDAILYGIAIAAIFKTVQWLLWYLLIQDSFWILIQRLSRKQLRNK